MPLAKFVWMELMIKRLCTLCVMAMLLLCSSYAEAQRKSSAKKPAPKKTTTQKKPVSKKKPVPRVTLAQAIPQVKDSLLERDIPLRNFDSILMAARRQETSLKSPDFNLGKTLGNALENFIPVQFKYAILLNESVEKLSNLVLYKNIDDWYGTRYRYGGKTTKGIDCSAFMQVISEYTFGWVLPRTAREQYVAMQGIKRDELREGDFVFFNTTGGISHVGMYLQNNKFIHASSSEGVSIGDLQSKYWSRRFIGARRMPEVSPATAAPTQLD
ncbi:C40 family peptidase [Phnomibacter sp. MR]|uniref:C40 family peptidase n=1 Tax=Phnomibacter sp. MR TaxID=3042318 RepID=UPI003A80009C